MGARGRTWAVLAALFMMGAVLAASGCLDNGDGDGDEKLVIPDDRKGEVLEVDGPGVNLTEVTIEEMVEMGLVDFEATFVNSVGTTFTANYSGIRLTDLMDRMGDLDMADAIEVIASDGYSAKLFLDQVDETTFIALREEGEWNDLSDAGVFRIVDTDLPSTYWVRDVSVMIAVSLGSIWTGGYTTERDLIDATWIREHASQEVSWQVGERTRTYTGVPMSEVLAAVGADETKADTLGLGTFSKLYEPVDLAVAKEEGVILVDSRGDYIYYQGPDGERVDKVHRFFVGTLLTVGGEVGDPYSMDTLALSDNDLVDVPFMNLTYGGDLFYGTPLSWLVAHAAPEASADAVRVSAGDDYFAVFPLSNLTDVMLAHMDERGEPLALDFGPFRIIDPQRPGPYHVGWVVDIEVFTSPALEATGDVQAAEAITLASIDAEQDTVVTYNDGKKDRTYPALSWDKVLELLGSGTSATHVNITDSQDNVVTWDIEELEGRMDGGVCVDSRGRFMAVYEELGTYVFDVASIQVG